MPLPGLSRSGAAKRTARSIERVYTRTPMDGQLAAFRQSWGKLQHPQSGQWRAEVIRETFILPAA